MNYEFPIIERIEDVLPAIEGRDEFVVAERDGFTVINYNVGFEDTFTIDETDLMENHGKMIPKGLMRRECRGIIFYSNGDLMSRPFHKFFNIGEREETQPYNIDMSRPHVIMEKLDGSMIRPMIVNNTMRLGTKMGITDTSILAEEYLFSLPKANKLVDILYTAAAAGATPLFEFIAPNNRIVIKYEKPDLVLLAVRVNRTGAYNSRFGNVERVLGNLFTTVQTYGSVEGSLEDYVERQRSKEGREGGIINFDGEMHKFKNDWYVRIHKVKDKIRADRHILALLLNNELDDVYPHLDENDFNRIKDYERKFYDALSIKVGWLEAITIRVIHRAKMDRKYLATVLLPASNLQPDEYKFVYKVVDGHVLREVVMDHIKSRLGNTAKYNELAAWLGIDKEEEDE